MMRVLHPGRMLRYSIYLILLATVFISFYTVMSMMSANHNSSVPSKYRYIDNKLLYLSEYMGVSYRLLGHQDYLTQGQITLHNTGNQDITPSNWTMYIFYMSPIDTDLFNYGSNPEPWFRIYRIQGNLYRMTPTLHFTVIRPGEKLQIKILSGTLVMAYTDLLPNWYVWSPGLEPRILRTTREDSFHEANFTEEFTEPNTLIRGPGDPFPPYTPTTRYAKNKIQYKPEIGTPILPTPVSVENTMEVDDFMTLDSDWVIIALQELQFEASLLAMHLGIKTVKKRPESKYIVMTVGNSPLPPGKYHLPDAYTLNIDKENEKIDIIGQSPSGVFYGLQSFFSIYEPLTKRIPAVRILDAPRFEYRGIMIDLARNFHSNRSELKRVIDALAMYKMNRLHLHLGDDEGWRLEIPGLPELTQIGGSRCHDLKEEYCILPALGSGPFANSSGTGYLSVDDYRALLKYAQERHVEIIPEFDMPGHGRAAIHSMSMRYNNYMKSGDLEKAREFLLSDPADRSSFMSGQFFTDNAINPCLESTYRFVEHVIMQLQKLHQATIPLKRFHFGGDEVPQNAYMDSPVCQKYMLSHPELRDTRDLKIHFIKRIAAIAARHNIGLQGWEDAFYGKEALPMSLRDFQQGTSVVTNVWWNMWEGGIGHRSNELANHDYKVVLSHATHFYFDHVQEPDPAERGLYWSIRYIDTKRVFGYIAEDIYENIDMRGMGEKWSREEACSQGVYCVSLDKPDNVIGLQGQLWAETVRTRSHQNLMLFPRVVALAERAWHRPVWERESADRRKALKEKDWARFASLLGEKETKRLDELDIHYRLPVPGAILSKHGLQVNTELPGLPIVYSQDSGQTWLPWRGNMHIRGNLMFASRSHDGRRMSRAIKIIV